MQRLKEAIKKAMEKWFEKRTEKHINLVKKYCSKILAYDKDRFPTIVEQGNAHDKSKYSDPERDGYVNITWEYKCKDDGVAFNVSEELREQMLKASIGHVKGNKHHPESWCSESNVINSKDRDKAVKLITVKNMPEKYIAEMVADWCAMSEERGNSPKSWADKTVGKRWKFSEENKKLIYELIKVLW